MNEIVQMTNGEAFLSIVLAFVLGVMFGAVIVKWWKEEDDFINSFFKKKGIKIHEGNATKGPHGCATFTHLTPPQGKESRVTLEKFLEPDINIINRIGLITLFNTYPYDKEIIKRIYPKFGFEKTELILNKSMEDGVSPEIIAAALSSKKEARKYGLQDYVKPKRRKP